MQALNMQLAPSYSSIGRKISYVTSKPPGEMSHTKTPEYYSVSIKLISDTSPQQIVSISRKKKESWA